MSVTLTTTLFISSEYVKRTSVVDPNVDDKYIGTSIKRVQDIELMYLIGTGLLNEIDGQISAGTLTQLNTTLLNAHLAPFIRAFSICYLLEYDDLKITNKGIVRKNSDNSISADQIDITRQINLYMAEAKFYAKRVELFLLQNITDYPLYINAGNAIDTIFPMRVGYDAGIHFTRRNRYVPFIERLKYPGYYGIQNENYY